MADLRAALAELRRVAEELRAAYPPEDENETEETRAVLTLIKGGLSA